MARLTLHVLGKFQVFIDDVPIQSFESDKVRALLAYLAVEADRPHSREALIGLLWPDCTEEAARHNLRQALFNLRLTLGDHTARPPYLLVSRNSIQFNRECDYSLDLALFNHRFSESEKGRGQKTATSSHFLHQLEEIVDLYRGEFLQHFYIADSSEFENWIVLQRETSRQQMMDVLTCLANEREGDGDFQAARRYALRQLELDPWREEAHLQIMRVLALDGQRSAALAQYENCKKILAEEFGVEPSAKTHELYELIRTDALKTQGKTCSESLVRPGPSLPVSLTSFLGREQELAALDRLISDPECRCITLIGPGGIGKTRLALQAATQHQNEYLHGSAFVPLSSVKSVEEVIPAIASAIEFAFCGPGDPKLQLLNYLRERRMLLILDNVEHLLLEGSQPATIADLLIEILQQAPQVNILVTSREALNIHGEWLFEVNGLSFPGIEQVNTIDGYSAVALFIQRARRVCTEFTLDAENKAAVAQICQLVEGMPLAIELAATWAKVLSPAEITIEIENNLDFLNSQLRDLSGRHRSMRAVFDYSWQMLSAEEKQVLGRLSVFRGGFSRQAAERVAAASLSVLSSLMLRSLLRRTPSGRYDLHELIRQYAASKVTGDPQELYSVQERHSQYYLDLLEERDVKLKSDQQKDTLAELTAEINNIRAAWDWAVANQKSHALYKISFTFCYLFALHNWFAEGEATFWRTAETFRIDLQESGQEDSMTQIALNAMLAHCGYFRLRLGKAEDAYAILASSAVFLRASGESSATIYALYYLGLVYLQLGRFNDARECLLESQALSRKYGENWHRALVGEFLGSLACGEGAYHQAVGYLKESLAVFRKSGDPMMISHGLSDLGHIMRLLGDFSEAEKLLQEGLQLAREMDYCRFGVGIALDGLGQVAYARGKHEEACAFFVESARLFQEIGDTHRLSQVLNYQGLALLALHDPVEAQKTFHAALRIAQEGGLIPSTLDALIGLATVDSYQNSNPETLELVLYILQHPAAAQETKIRAEQLQIELESRLSYETVGAAQRLAMSRSLEDFIHLFLVCV